MSHHGKHVIRLGSLHGEYLMQLVATDENAGRKQPPVPQWIDFEVVAAR